MSALQFRQSGGELELLLKLKHQFVESSDRHKSSSMPFHHFVNRLVNGFAVKMTPENPAVDRLRFLQVAHETAVVASIPDDDRREAAEYPFQRGFPFLGKVRDFIGIAERLKQEVAMNFRDQRPPRVRPNVAGQ